MIKLQNVSVCYGKVRALENVSITVEKGKIVCLLGANGAGKSTVLRVISGLVPVESGTIYHSDKDISKLEPNRIVKEGIIHCPENRQVFPFLTVEENIRIGSYARKDKDQVKRDYEKVMNLFPKLKSRLRQYAGTLSGGEQQMLAIGRSLMGNPKVLLLDEPSLGLAPLIIREIFRIIQKINEEGTSILLVEQNAYKALSICDYGYVLENGRVALSGSSDQLTNDSSIKKLYLGIAQ